MEPPRKRPAPAADTADLFRRGGPKAIRVDGVGDVAESPVLDSVATADARASHPDGALARHPRQASRLRNLVAAWSTPLGASPNALSVAVWRARDAVAEVVRARGRHLAKFGYAVGAKTYLHPEEALFLVETERLVLLADERGVAARAPMSLRAVRAATTAAPREGAAAGVPPDAYAIFAHLARRGYVPRRHGAPWTWSGRDPVRHERMAGTGAWSKETTARPNRSRQSEDSNGDANDANDDDDDERVENHRDGDDESNDEVSGEVRISDGTSASAGWWPSAARHPWFADASNVRRGGRRRRLNPKPKPEPPTALYRVYLPDANFSKRAPPPPAFWVLRGEPPTLAAVREAARAIRNVAGEGSGGTGGAGSGDVDARADGEGANTAGGGASGKKMQTSVYAAASDPPRLVFATVSEGTVMMHAAHDASVGIRTATT